MPEEDYKSKMCRHGKAQIPHACPDYSAKFGGAWFQDIAPECPACVANPPSIPYALGAVVPEPVKHVDLTTINVPA